MVGLLIIAVTLARLLMNMIKFHRTGNSHNIANVEIFCAAFVANAPPLYGLLNMKYGSSSQRSQQSQRSQRSRSNPTTSHADKASQQLDTFSNKPIVTTKHQGSRHDWATHRRRTGELDSDEESIIVCPPLCLDLFVGAAF